MTTLLALIGLFKLGWIVFVLFLFLIFFLGGLKNKKYDAILAQREKELRSIVVVAVKRAPQSLQNQQLVTGNVVVSLDIFRQLLAIVRNIIGGNFRGYEALLERAKREAILRMKEKAKQSGANIIFNVKMESVSLTNAQYSDGYTTGKIEVLVYGTAGTLPRKTKNS